MGLRSPMYLDSETLLAAAEYHGVDFPRGVITPCWGGSR